MPIISNDYFSSEYIQQIEIARAFERFNAGKCRIVPVIARACAWESDIRLAKLQALPPGGTAIGSWPNRDEALQSIVSGITLLVRPDHQPGLYTDIPSTGSGPLPWRKKHRLALLVSVILLVVLAGLAGRYFIQDGTPVNPTTILESGNGEHSDFEKALSAGTIPAMRAFLRQYPDGIKAGDAGNAIQNLQKELDFNVASAFQLIEGDEWKAATDAYDKAFRINPDDPKLHALQEKIKGFANDVYIPFNHLPAAPGEELSFCPAKGGVLRSASYLKGKSACLDRQFNTALQKPQGSKRMSGSACCK